MVEIEKWALTRCCWTSYIMSHSLYLDDWSRTSQVHLFIRSSLIMKKKNRKTFLFCAFVIRSASFRECAYVRIILPTIWFVRQSVWKETNMMAVVDQNSSSLACFWRQSSTWNASLLKYVVRLFRYYRSKRPVKLWLWIH